MDQFFEESVRQQILYGVAASLLAALVIFLWQRILRILRLVPQGLGVGFQWLLGPGSQKTDYLTRLDAELFQIRHPWMKEKQVLQDILVPVTLDTSHIPNRGSGAAQNIEVVLREIFSNRTRDGLRDNTGAHNRVVLLGGPGSGKSVALRMATRLKDSIFSGQTTPLPVHLTFAEYRDAGFDLVAAVVRSLESRGFPGKDIISNVNPVGSSETLAKRLRQGAVFVLVDALDELDVRDRARAARKIAADLRAHPSIPAILTCRSAFWTGQIRLPHRIVLRMADLSPTIVREFISRWKFRPPKTHQELVSLIGQYRHIGELARNPLMLTIVAFLYSQPKYRLPENRAQFYEVCVRALIEEWDQAQNPERANRFDRPHKEHILASLAFAHFNGGDRDSDINENWALKHLALTMENDLGLRRADNVKMLDEIVSNSGLLLRVSDAGLRFPHQTFLEFFTALWLLDTSDVDFLLERIEQDRSGWREVALLFCGLNTNKATSSRVLTTLLRLDCELSVAALCDSRIFEASVAREILGAAREEIAGPSKVAIVEKLGYLAADTRSSLASEASVILEREFQVTIREGLPDSEFAKKLLVAYLQNPTDEKLAMVLSRVGEVHLGEMIPSLGETAIVLLSRILCGDSLTAAGKTSFIDGLRQANAIALLLEILCSLTLDRSTRHEALVALARNSRLSEFWKEIDSDKFQRHELVSECYDLDLGSWPWPEPVTPSGRIWLQEVVVAVSEQLFTLRRQALFAEVDSRVLTCAYGEALQKETAGKRQISAPDILDRTTLAVLRSVWLKLKSPMALRWISGHKSFAMLTALFTFILSGTASSLALAAASEFVESGGSVPMTAHVSVYLVAVLVVGILACFTGLVHDGLEEVLSYGLAGIVISLTLGPLYAFSQFTSIRRVGTTIESRFRFTLAFILSGLGIAVFLLAGLDFAFKAIWSLSVFAQSILILVMRWDDTDLVSYPICPNSQTSELVAFMLRDSDSIIPS